MDPMMTIAEIESEFGSEWVLIGDPKTDDSLHVTAGKVLWHSADRDEVYRKAVELRPKSFAVLFTGPDRLPRGMEMVLGASNLMATEGSLSSRLTFPARWAVLF